MSFLKEIAIHYSLTSKFNDVVPWIVNAPCLHPRDIVNGSPVLLPNIDTLRNKDSAVDAIEGRIWQLQMIGCMCILH